DITGRLRVAKNKDTQWQRKTMSLYRSVGEVVKNATGYDAFIFYGTLLGQVRENDFIGHDDDFDAAYLSKAKDGPTAASELRDIAYALIDSGFQVQGRPSALHIHDPLDLTNRIDLFHTYFDKSGRLALP